MSVDAQPDSSRSRRRRAPARAGAAPARRGASLRSRRRRRRATHATRRLDGRNRCSTRAFRPFIQSKNSRLPARVPSGRPGLSTLTTVAPARASSCPHSGPAHIEDRSATSRPAASRARRPGTPWPYSRTGGPGFAQARRGDVEQGRALDDRGDRTRCGPAPQHRPGVAGHVVGLHQRGDGGDVVGARQRDRAPAVATGQQPGGATGRHPAAAGQTRAARPARPAARRRRS